MKNENIWTTKDGQALEIQWMTTPHIAHSINMVMRKSGLKIAMAANAARKPQPFATLYNEMKARKLMNWNTWTDQLNIPKHRESLLEMCMLRALIDTGAAEQGILIFNDQPGDFLETFRTGANPWLNNDLVLKFTEYRLARA